MVCSRSARSFSLRREIVKHEASVNAAPNPRIVCAGLVGSTVTSAAAAFFATFVHAISAPAASRFPLLSVISVCAGFVGACPSCSSVSAFAFSPNADAAAAPMPSPAYLSTSRRVVTLDPRLSLKHSHRPQPKPVALLNRILQNLEPGTPLSPFRTRRKGLFESDCGLRESRGASVVRLPRLLGLGPQIGISLRDFRRRQTRPP